MSSRQLGTRSGAQTELGPQTAAEATLLLLKKKKKATNEADNIPTRQAGWWAQSPASRQLLSVAMSFVPGPDWREWQPRVLSLSSWYPRLDARHQGRSPSPLWISWALLGLDHRINVI